MGSCVPLTEDGSLYDLLPAKVREQVSRDDVAAASVRLERPAAPDPEPAAATADPDADLDALFPDVEEGTP